jgi:hypothetical protein
MTPEYIKICAIKAKNIFFRRLNSQLNAFHTGKAEIYCIINGDQLNYNDVN